jgi:hypothetical protein
VSNEKYAITEIPFPSADPSQLNFPILKLFDCKLFLIRTHPGVNCLCVRKYFYNFQFKAQHFNNCMLRARKGHTFLLLAILAPRRIKHQRQVAAPCLHVVYHVCCGIFYQLGSLLHILLSRQSPYCMATIGK